MTDKQFEQNKLIQAFLGWELVWTHTIPQMYSGWSMKNSETGEILTDFYNNSILNFTGDYNWLLKALYKFDNLDLLESENSQDYSWRCDDIDYAVTHQDAVDALCDGIIWYNKIK